MTDVSETVNTFFTQFPTVIVTAKTSILRETDSIYDIYYLKKGLIRQYMSTEDGDEITLQIFKPGSFFPIMLALAKTQNTATFVALEDSILHKAPVGKSLEFLKSHPDVLLDLTERFAKGIVGLIEKVKVITYQNSYTRVISLLLYLAKKYSAADTGNLSSVTLNFPLTHQEISTFIGLKRETVSRQMENLIKKGLLTTKNHVISIPDMNKLEKELHT